jgi:hypothetical protein
VDTYAPDTERLMKRLFDSLGEKDRRRYAAIEATKLRSIDFKYAFRHSSITSRKALCRLRSRTLIDCLFVFVAPSHSRQSNPRAHTHMAKYRVL